MKQAALIIIWLSLLYVVHAQTKTKTSQTPVKPSKQTTIKYLADKLNANCTGEFQVEHETWSKFGNYSMQYERSNNCENYSVEEVGGLPFIIVNMKTKTMRYDFETKEKDNTNGSITIKIPILKSTLSIVNIPKKSETNGAIAKSSEAFRCLAFTTAEKVIIWNDNEKNETKNASIALIPSFNVDFEENFKRAILNLKSYYKEEVDPFDTPEDALKVKAESLILQLLKKHSVTGYKWLENAEMNRIDLDFQDSDSRFEINGDTLIHYSKGRSSYTTLDDTTLSKATFNPPYPPASYITIKNITSIELETMVNYYRNLDKKYEGFVKTIHFRGNFPGLLFDGNFVGKHTDAHIICDFLYDGDPEFIQLKEAFKKLTAYYQNP